MRMGVVGEACSSGQLSIGRYSYRMWEGEQLQHPCCFYLTAPPPPAERSFRLFLTNVPFSLIRTPNARAFFQESSCVPIRGVWYFLTSLCSFRLRSRFLGLASLLLNGFSRARTGRGVPNIVNQPN